MTATIFLYIFSCLTLLFAICVISMKNAVHSAIFLIFSILCIAGLFFMLNAEFLGTIQILVYAGGIMVIYLFIIFLIDLEPVKTRKRPFYITAVSIVLLIVLGLEIAYLLLVRDRHIPGIAATDNLNLNVFSHELLKVHVIPFELASLVLIGALVAAIYLARRQPR